MHDSIGSRQGAGAALILSLVTLSGCSSDGAESSKSALSLDAADLVETTMSGSVGDGPITDGQVAVKNVRGEILATQRSDEQARYRILVTASPDEFPLTATVDDGTDLVSGDRPSFALTTAILQPGGEQTANLNPHGTIAVRIAQQMPGGLSADNLNSAIGIVIRNLGFGIEARAITNPISTPIVEQNVASMVRASEALGETIRRVHSTLLSGGNFANEDALVEALGDDLVDGVLDGQGLENADPRLAATTSIVSAQVMLEVMTNRLTVGDVIATQALDASIQQVTGGNMIAPLTGTLNITGPMLNQARLLVDAAARIDSDPALDDLAAALAAIQPGESPAQVTALLPAGAVAALGDTVQQVALATDEELAVVNEVVREALPPIEDPANRLPTIFGVPATTILVGTTYEFVPTAADADGDALLFGVVGLPSWATFDMNTGRVTGVPSDADVGTSAPIQLSVSDGFDSASLPEFRITVERQPNRSPTILGTPPATVTIGNLYSFVPAAVDPDGDALTFSVVNLPAWATFDPTTGTLAGTPQAVDAGDYSGVQITVTDGDDRASLPAFLISVSAIPNQAPAISGTPGTQVMVGNSYVFTPSASDADGDPLTYSVAGMPQWAGFSSVTGRLSGTPADGDEGTYAGIVISVTDGRDSASLPAFSITVSPPPNAAPTISGTPQTSATAGDAYTFTPSTADADGDSLTFSIVARPAWASFDAANGRLSGTPGTDDVGTYPGISIRVSDGRDTSELPAFAINVAAPPNTAPTISGTPQTSITVGSPYSFAPTASDADGDTLTFSIAGRPGWASFSSASGQLSGTPLAADIGTYGGIRISVTDGQEIVTLPEFSVDVNDLPNRAPTISGAPSTAVTVGSVYAFSPTASDVDGDTLTFSIAAMPSWAAFDAATGQLSGAPGPADIGAHTGISIGVTDGVATATLPDFAITVSDIPNQAPAISGTPATQVSVDAVYSFTPTASDADGDALTFSIANRPIWANFDVSNGRLSGTPVAGDEGSYPNVRISVSDGKDTASLQAFTITVVGLPNTPPTISGSPTTAVTAGDAYLFIPTASDADGDSLSFTITGKPSWATFDGASGRLSGTPAAGSEGVYSGIRISVSDGTDTATLPTFTISVTAPPNTPPTISGSPAASVTVGDAYAFTPAANDADGDNLIFSVSGLPGWAGFDAGTGRVSGVPADNDEGLHSGIVISVSDGEDSASMSAFSINVNPRPNQPPSISGSPAAEVTVNSAYSFRPTASDPDGDSLSFSIAGMPAWAGFDAATGQLSGTPVEGEEGTYSGIRISVADGTDTVSLPAFAIIVNALPNTPPTISGSPATSVTVGNAYTFTPTANDADGDNLSFAISGKPGWASFDSGNGRLSGTPAGGDEGTYSAILISVSDGQASAALGAFAISVAALPNSPPTISGTPAAEVTVGSGYAFNPSASDPDGDNLTFSISGKPDWADFDTSSGALSGTPVVGDEGNYAGIRISVSDGDAAAAVPDFSISVVAQTLGTAMLNWDAPIENADGTFLDDLAGFKVYYGPALDNYTQFDTIPNPGVATHLVENLGPGTWFFVVTAYDTAGNESVYSEVVSKTIP